MNKAQQKLRTALLNTWKLRLFMLMKLPMGLLAGLRVRHLDEEKTITSVPYKNLNKNPFRSIYFAVQSMAAELSTACACQLAIEGISPSVAFIVVDIKGEFSKKANGRVYYTCEDNPKAFEAVDKCLRNGEAQTATFKTTGKMKNGTEVAVFHVTWSFKQRSA